MEVEVAGSLATGSGQQEADGRPAWPAEALLQLCGRGQRVWAALHGPCNMLVWWSLRHGGVTGSGHDRHRADGMVLYGVTLPVLSVYGGTGAGHSPRLGRQVSADLARSEAGPVPRPCAAVYG